MTGPTQGSRSGYDTRAEQKRERPQNTRSRTTRRKQSTVVPTADVPQKQKRAWRLLRCTNDAPGWVLSLLFHAALLIVLALITVSLQFRDQLPEILAVFGEQQPAVIDQQFDLASESIEVAVADNSLQALETQERETQWALPLPLEMESDQPLVMEHPETAQMLETIASIGSEGLSGRFGENKAKLIAREGGTPQSEAAVALGLQWLANHQNRNGSWSFNHQAGPCRGRCGNPGSMGHCTTGATGLALLCFLGAGHSEYKGEYRNVVQQSVKYLVSAMKKNRRNPGDLRGPVRDNEGMYAHGIATLALCEAYNMGRNPKLREPVQQALDFIVRAQDPRGGGWRYELRQQGDTSVLGWQTMALYSGKIAELNVPQNTLDGAWAFLESVEAEDGVGYGYTSSTRRVSPTLSAVGLLCRIYLGQTRNWDTTNPSLQEGADRLVALGPSRNDMYYNYYATQFMYQIGGVKWRSWNDVMRDALVASQVQDGHAAGSWLPTCRHGGRPGGRLYMTAMCILTLEVYYRHLPIYDRSRPETDADDNAVGQ